MRMHPEQSRLILAGHVDMIEGIAGFGKEPSVFSDYVLSCNCGKIIRDDMPYLDDITRSSLLKRGHGFLMGNEMLLSAFGRPESLPIANPDSRWRHGAEAPLVGFRGVANLTSLLVNEMVRMG